MQLSLMELRQSLGGHCYLWQVKANLLGGPPGEKGGASRFMLFFHALRMLLAARNVAVGKLLCEFYRTRHSPAF